MGSTKSQIQLSIFHFHALWQCAWDSTEIISNWQKPSSVRTVSFCCCSLGSAGFHIEFFTCYQYMSTIWQTRFAKSLPRNTVLLVFPVTSPGGADPLHSPDKLWVILGVPLRCLFSHSTRCSLSILSLVSASLEVKLLPHLPLCVLTVSSLHLRPFPVLVHWCKCNPPWACLSSGPLYVPEE